MVLIFTLHNVQISRVGDATSATVNSGLLPDLSNATLEDYQGYNTEVVKAARLWYSSIGGEMPLEITPKVGDTKLGFAISRTEEVSFLSPLPEYRQYYASSIKNKRVIHQTFHDTMFLSGFYLHIFSVARWQWQRDTVNTVRDAQSVQPGKRGIEIAGHLKGVQWEGPALDDL